MEPEDPEAEWLSREIKTTSGRIVVSVKCHRDVDTFDVVEAAMIMKQIANTIMSKLSSELNTKALATTHGLAN